MSDGNATEKWLLVLGAGSTIATAAAKRFARAGWSAYLASRNLDELEKTSADIRLRYGVDAKPLYFDALDTGSHEKFYRGLPVKPDGVLMAFGVLGDQKQAESDFKHARDIIGTNFLGAVSMLEIIAGDMEERGSGFIAGISSVAGDRGRQSNYMYGSSKAGLTVYLAGLRHRLFRKGVHVVTVKPGFVATKMTEGLDLPGKLTAQPETVANAIFNAVRKRKNTVYVTKIWRLIMLVIIHLPEFIFKRTNL